MSPGSEPDPASLELVRRLLTHVPFGPEIELVVGALPASQADQLPLPADARLLGSVLRDREGRRSALEAVFNATGEPGAVLAAYQRQLQALGWEVFEGGPGPMHGGFMPARSGEGIMLRRGGSGPVLRAAAAPVKGNALDLRVTLDWEMPRHMAEWRAHRPPDEGRLPSLHPPDGVTVHPRGGGGGGGHWEQRAIAETEQPAVVLEGHFAEQLLTEGWTRDDGGAEDKVAWSSWRLPGDGEWRGLLLVLALFRSRRSLWLGIEAAEPNEESGGFSTMIQRG